MRYPAHLWLSGAVLLAGCQLVLGFEEHELAAGGNAAGGKSGDLPVGAPCSTGDACATDHCIDGVCCAQACNGSCLACSEALTGEPDGTCSFVSSETDPHDDCTSGGPECFADVCSGTGPSCKPAADGTACGEDGCIDGTLSRPTCDAGTCDPMSSECAGGFGCDGADCATSCSGDDALCAGDFHCSGTTCIEDLAIGGACTRDAQCPGDRCVDGVCCDAPCDGQCEMCQPDGVCGLVPNGQDDPEASCPGNQICCNGACQANCN